MSDTQELRPAEAKPASVKTSRATKTALGLLLILAAGATGLSAYLYTLQQQSRTDMEVLKNQLATLQQNQQPLTTTQRAQQDTLIQLTDAQKTLDSKQEQLEKQWQDQANKQPKDWNLAEASYLINMAERKLWLEQDTRTAIALLQDTDHTIQQLSDTSFLPVRQALASDIAAIQAAPAVDTDGIILRLNALMEKTEQLKIKGLITRYDVHEEQNQVSSDIGDWQTNLTKSAKHFMTHFITIRRRDQSEPLLSPEQAVYLKSNLQIQLRLAELALEQHDNTLYRQYLEKASQWIQRYYTPDDGVTRYMETELTSLQHMDIEPHFPKTLAAKPLLARLMGEQTAAATPASH